MFIIFEGKGKGGKDQSGKGGKAGKGKGKGSKQYNNFDDFSYRRGQTPSRNSSQPYNADRSNYNMNQQEATGAARLPFLLSQHVPQNHGGNQQSWHQGGGNNMGYQQQQQNFEWQS